MNCKLWDRKFEYYDLATEKDLDFLWFLFSDFHDNWLRPPNGVPSRIWANIVGEILAIDMGLHSAGQILLTDTIYELLSESESQK